MQFLFFDVEDLLRGLWASLCQLIYRLVAWLYELFMNVARVEILTTEDIQPIYQRVTMVLTIIMVFYVTFEAVKYVVQPDSFTDKEKGGGKLTFKMVIVVILIAFVPTIFTWAYKFQNVIFDNQVFSKIILGNPGVNTGEFGRVFSSNLLGMFYRTDEDVWGKEELEEEDNCDDLPCNFVVKTNLSTLATEGELPLMQIGLTDGDETDSVEEGDVFHYYIHFDGLFAVAVGIFVCYMLVLYCIDTGVRVAQLTFLQIIAPIPIIGYLSPKKDGIFQKWLQQCTTTYLDLFLRVSIIYFGLLICQILTNSFSSETLFRNLPGISGTMKTFIYIVLILGILMFLHKAPKLLQELFPQRGAASGNFGLKAGDRVAPLAARAAGAAIGGTRAIGGAVARGRNAFLRNKERKIARNKARDERLAAGDTRTDRQVRRENRAARKAADKDYKQQNKAYNKSAKDTRKQLEEIENNKTLTNAQKQAQKAAIMGAHTSAVEQRENALNRKINATNAVMKDRQNRYESVAWSSTKGAAAGGYHGVTEGFKATKLEDIGKQVKAGAEADKAAINAREKWLDAGGVSTVGRMVSNIEQKMGVQTSAQRTEQQIATIDTDIKKYEDLKAGASAIMTSADNATDNDLKKMSEGGIKSAYVEYDATQGKYVQVGSIEYEDNNGNKKSYSIKPGETLSSIYGRVSADVNTAEDLLRKEIEAGDPAKIAAAQLQLSEARAKEKALHKKLKNNNFDQMLRAWADYKADPENKPKPTKMTDQFDTGSATLVHEMLANLEVQNKNPGLVAEMRNILGESSPEFKAFIDSSQLRDHKTYKAIENALKEAQANLNEKIIAKKSLQQNISSSVSYQVDKANDAAAGGKK